MVRPQTNKNVSANLWRNRYELVWLGLETVCAGGRTSSPRGQGYSQNGKKGRAFSPVFIAGRQIAQTFWGKGWCDHLESHSDFENRLRVADPM